MSTSNRYGRRTFLGGAGAVVIGLPFLETLAPRPARAAAAAVPKRFLGYFTPNGIWMADYRPVGMGPTFQWGPTMGPSGRVFNDGLGAYPASEDGPSMEAVRSDVLLISGLQNTLQAGRVPGDHSGGTGSFLTNRTVSKAANATMGGPSIDYLLSKAIGQGSRRPYLAMSGETARPPGVLCDSGFSCSVGGHVSFDDQGKNLPLFDSPGQIFDQLFMGATPSTPAAADALLKRRMRNQSILDVVNKEVATLQPTLSYQDRPRLDEYLTSVREVERRISTLPTGGMACTIPARPGAFVLANGRQSIDICHDLMALAFQCDVTRVISFMWGTSTSARPHNFIGAPGGHHDTSHHGGGTDVTNTNASVSKLRRIDYWFFRRFAELLLRLKKVTDFDGRTVLDNTLVFLSSDISDGNQHNHTDMPVVLAGGAAGFKTGQHIMAPTDAWFGDLFLCIAKGFDVNSLTTFGEQGKTPFLS